MIVILEVMQIVAPVFVLAAIGYGWVQMGWRYDIEFVSKLTLGLAIPVLVFRTLVQAELPGEVLAELILASLLCYGVLAAVFYGLLRVMKESTHAFLGPMVFGNTGNIGLPIALYAFGEAGLAYAVIVLAAMLVLQFTFGIWQLSGHTGGWRFLREPMMIGCISGLVFQIFHLSLPIWVDETLQLIGQMGIPLMLITLGVAIARLPVRSLGNSLKLALLKYILTIALSGGVAVAFGFSAVISAVLILQIAMPVAVTSYMLSEKYKAKPEEIASLVVTSTLLAVFVIPCILVFTR